MRVSIEAQYTICYNSNVFTGIITHVGSIVEKTSKTLTVQSHKKLIKKLKNGTSIAVNGICLTVVGLKNNTFTIDFMPETSNKTNIQYYQKGTLVNLELPATSETFLAGHIVQGHIDGVGRITDITKKGNSRIFTFSIPKSIEKYIVDKGSIALNGISLTVINVENDKFIVGIIPHTWDKTMLHAAKIGDFVNIEVDILAKYVEKLISKNKN